MANEEALAFDYRVTNPFTYDIRVCLDQNVFESTHISTMIDNDAVQIKLSLNLGADRVFINAPSISKYLKLV